MTSRDFCFWLQGLFELTSAGDLPNTGPMTLTAQQTAMVKAHLAMVFKHEIDPSQGTPEHQAELQKLHDEIKEVASTANAAASHHAVYRC